MGQDKNVEGSDEAEKKLQEEPSPQSLPIVVDTDNLGKFLGREKFTTDRLYEVTPPGIVSSICGDMLD